MALIYFIEVFPCRRPLDCDGIAPPRLDRRSPWM
jgi:hypothetical protein